MNHELAKKLKDAGFPKVGTVEISYQGGIEEELWFPSLSDLIEACDTKIHHFELRHIIAGQMNKWFAGDDMHAAHGDTPVEAVVNLWLLKHNK